LRQARGRAILAAALAATSALAGALMACGGDDDPSDVPTPRATEQAVFASPTIEAQKLTSTEKGYTVTFPEGWNIRANYGTIQGESLDIALLDDAVTSSQVRPTLTIGCFPHQAGSAPDQAEFQQARVSAVRNSLAEPPVLTTRQVAGVQASVATYTKQIDVGSGQVDSIRQQDVFFVGPLCSFSLSLLSAPEDEGLFQPQFDAMADSFAFLP
jgi:hypothetical protein